MLTNAEKFTNNGNISVSVELKDKKFACVKVIDTGVGIEENVKS